MMSEQDSFQGYWFGLMDMGRHLREWGVKETLKDLKNDYPKEYKELVLAVLDELPK